MESSLTLSEQEHRWYWDLFNTYDVEGCGVLVGPQVSDLFMTSGLPAEIIHQVDDQRVATVKMVQVL